MPSPYPPHARPARMGVCHFPRSRPVSTARGLVAALLLGAAAFPLCLPLAEAARAGWAPSGRELGRVLDLAGNTAALAGLTLLLALPAGTLLAVLLYLSD